MKNALVLSTFLAATLSAFGAGRQLTGQHAPATTPALSPADAQRKFSLPDGFEIRLFAAEPDVINPVAMTWDERGRLWVVELYEYPLGAPKGAKPRDRIKILEDTDGDGKVDKVTVFADGLNLATGIQLGYGGVYVGQAPDLLFLEDTDGDGVADKRTILMTGFGLDDRHELLNSFAWGPDGYLYMTHGVFTFSKVKDPTNPNDSGVQMTAAVARLHPRTKKFEVFAEGTSNPWGVDWDKAGNAFVSACVIDHMFHMAAGGVYVRQGGVSANPYTYELIPSIVDHKHHMAAYAGVQIYQGNQFPDEYKGTILIGNIHDNAIHQDRLTPVGSSFRSSFIKDFVRANDGWFMPVSTQVGPDGAVWIMDWYDKYPCYQNANADPEGVDREHGRIWRVVYTGNDKGKPVSSRPEVNMNLSKLSSEGLVAMLRHPNVWQRRMAQRLLNERRDAVTKTPLVQLANDGKTIEARTAAFWTLFSSEQLDDATLERLAKDKEPIIRSWAARFTGEGGHADQASVDRLEELAGDSDPRVRLATATAIRQFTSGALTVDTAPRSTLDADIGPTLSKLVKLQGAANDPLTLFMIWSASEPLIAKDPKGALNWFAENGISTLDASRPLLRKTMRRICDTHDAEKLNVAIEFLNNLPDSSGLLAIAALDGLLEGQKGQSMAPPASAGFVGRLMKSEHREVVSRAQQLGTIWGDPVAIESTLAVAQNAHASEDQRLQAIQSLRRQKLSNVRDGMISILGQEESERVTTAAVQALGENGSDAVPGVLLQRWKSFPPAVRRAAAEVLVSRQNWTRQFLGGVSDKTIDAGEIPATVLRSLAQSKDEFIRNEAVRVIGRFREPNQDKTKLIAQKKAMILNGKPDLEAGHQIAKKACFICHKLYGEGAEVGPDLTGVGRSSMDALLANVIDPNQIVGKGYENVEVETKDGRTISGRVVEETDARIKLLSAGPKEEVIAKSDIASKRVSELSVMPEGLEQMPDDDFRNLIWFIYNPPQEKKRASIDLPTHSAESATVTDGESIALWNPEWRVIAPEFDGTPAKLPEFAGQRNVLMTHPFDEKRGAGLERKVAVPIGLRTLLSATVAAHEEGDWELRVVVEGTLVKKETIDQTGERWKTIQVDLTRFAGRTVVVRLENCVYSSHFEFAYWANIRIQSTEIREARR
ncbi:MAG: rane-bound dehydrogenase domain protein [Verrucomicrobiales bacterium]|nr:rane-bound dehydrogenase domain protein [Verrucomicrobiales bacterium]